MSFRYRLPYSVTLGPQRHSFFDYPPVPIKPIESLGFFSVTTGSSYADTIIKWGFWIGLGLAAHRLYRVARYDEPFIQWGGGTPAAWEMNPDSSDAHYRETLKKHGVPLPPDEHQIINIRYRSDYGDWYILVDGVGWFWLDRSEKKWKFLPWGITTNPDPEEFDRVCSYCKRVFIEGEWIPGDYRTEWATHGICDDCMVQVMRDIEEEERRRGKV